MSWSVMSFLATYVIGYPTNPASARRVLGCCDPVEHHPGLLLPSRLTKEKVGMSARHMKGGAVLRRDLPRHVRRDEPIVFSAHHEHGHVNARPRHIVDAEDNLAHRAPAVRNHAGANL